MTGSATTAAAADAPATAGRRYARWIALAAAVVAAVVVGAWVAGPDASYGDPFDPQNPGPDGAQAVARVLADQGVEVSIVRSAADLAAEPVDGATSVVVTGTHRLSDSTTRRLLDHSAAGRLVLVEPAHAVLDHFATAVSPRTVSAPEVAGGCASYDDLGLSVDQAVAWGDSSTGCFETADGPLLVDLRPRDGGPETVAFGAGEALTNDQVLRADNAAVALRLLGQDERLVWYLPSYDDAAPGEAVGLASLLPDWLLPSLVLALLAGAALVWWRGRRLGPLSTEPLPVVVRAAETAHSRGRMYQRSNDREHAARALRAATRRRAAERLHLGHRAGEAALVAALAAHLGRPAAEIATLVGTDAPPPRTDDDLVRLAHELARIDHLHDGGAPPSPREEGRG